MPTITSEVVNSDGGVPVGAEIVGASPATAVTAGSAELDEPAGVPADVATGVASGVAAGDDSDEGELLDIN